MTTEEFITELFCRVDDLMLTAEKTEQAHLYPSEVVTLGLLFALKGSGNRAFYRWLDRDYHPMFPRLPERTRLFRLFNEQQHWTQKLMAAPSLIGLIDTYGIELIHPRREGRSEHQIGRKGKSNWRWIVGGKLCLLLNHLGLVVGWACDTVLSQKGDRLGKEADGIRKLEKLGGDTKQTIDQLDLGENVALFRPFHLPFSDHVHRLVACQCALRRVEGKETEAGSGAAFDEAMILLDQIVEVFYLTQLTICR